jgi:NDP-sugar pyrophosphorylase family protein
MLNDRQTISNLNNQTNNEIRSAPPPEEGVGGRLAMIFAAGLGTRLKPLTDFTPKALVPVGEKPLLQHIIEKLSNAGFKEIVINAHHFSEQIVQFLQNNDNFGLQIDVSDESDKLLDTGGGIRKASAFLKGDAPFLVHNVDILSNADLRELYDNHIQQEEMATLLVSQRKTSRYLLFDEQHVLKGWINDSTGEVKSPYPGFSPEKYRRFAFAGIQVVSPQIFDRMQNMPDKFSIIDFYLSIAADVKIKAYPVSGLEMIDVGKIDSLKEAEEFYLKNV